MVYVCSLWQLLAAHKYAVSFAAPAASAAAATALSRFPFMTESDRGAHLASAVECVLRSGHVVLGREQ